MSKSIKKILIIGAECTGKSTLAQALAELYSTTYAAEYMRTYLTQKPYGYVCTFDDLTAIAKGQLYHEQDAIRRAHRYCFIDTSLLLLHVYAQHYFYESPAFILENLSKQTYDLILVTDELGIDWAADGMRDLPNGRHKMRLTIINELKSRQLEYHTISGDLPSRIAQVVRLLAHLDE